MSFLGIDIVTLYTSYQHVYKDMRTNYYKNIFTQKTIELLMSIHAIEVARRL